MPSYTINYPHPVNKVTWHRVSQGIRINVVPATNELSPPKSPDLKAVDSGINDMELDNCPRTSSAVSLVVHHSGLDLYRQSSVVVQTAERASPESGASTPCDDSETKSITILTPSHTSADMMNSRGTLVRCHNSTGGECSMGEQCDCLRMDRLETLQHVLADERKDRPTFEERVKKPLVLTPRDVLTGTALASFDLAFPEVQANMGYPLLEGVKQFEMPWEDLD